MELLPPTAKERKKAKAREFDMDVVGITAGAMRALEDRMITIGAFSRLAQLEHYRLAIPEEGEPMPQAPDSHLDTELTEIGAIQNGQLMPPSQWDWDELRARKGTAK